MASGESPSYDERVLLIAPTRRDGEVTSRALASIGIACTVCPSLGAVARDIQRGLGALMMTDSALVDPDFNALIVALDHQPAWSSVPIVILCHDRDQIPKALIGIDRLRNVTLIDRPASIRSMISAVEASLRGRRWQYQIRDQLVAQLEAEEALRQADQRKDEFLATLAHELRNPLAPLTTGLQLLKRTCTSKDGSPPFDMMQRQLEQLVKLIDELLDVSRIATGKVVLHREIVDMRSVVGRAVEACQPALSAAAHALGVNLPSQAVCVFGDPSRLAQAIGNLLNNATKYTPNGGCIGVALVASGHEVVVTVNDSGMGIPSEMLTRVFDMFTQVDRTLDRAQGGLGIGLSLVQRLIIMHGGSVTARSAGLDRGSSFEIRLPMVAATSSTIARETLVESEDDAGRRRLRVLIVDDNADAADSMAMLLQLNGHEVRVEYSARSALMASRDFTPDAIFCDIGMPGMSGHEFASQLRRDRRFASTLLIAVTGWGAEEDRRRSRAAGFDHHLTKPADVDSIEAILSRR